MRGAVQIGHHNRQTNLQVEVTCVASPHPSGGGTVHNLPAASAVFVGRDLDRLATVVHDGPSARHRSVAVHGLGGVGKSAFALRFARRFLHRYRLVWWVTADSAENVERALAALTRRLHPAPAYTDAPEWARGWLQGNGDWLIVLDDVEDIAHVRPLLGAIGGRGDVVLTTRRDYGAARWATFGLTALRLGVLARDASVDMLVRLTGCADRAGAARLAAELADLPLALEQAAGYVSQHPAVGFDGYRERLAGRFDRYAAHPGIGGEPGRTVARVWTLSMRAIAERSSTAARVLAVLAWFAPDDLPVEILSPLADDPDEVMEALALLASYHIVSTDGRVIAVHRLVQAVTRSAPPDPAGDAEQPVETAVRLLDAALPADQPEPSAVRPAWDALLPHLDALVAAAPPDRIGAPLSRVAARAARYRHDQGRLASAAGQFEWVLACRRRQLGGDHPDTLAARHDLAGCYEEMGRVGEAVELLEAVLADRRRVLGADHPDTLASCGLLAHAYALSGRLSRAVELLEGVLADRRRVLGSDHPDTLATRGLLGYVYRRSGRVEEAIGLYEGVAADQRRLLGADHPRALKSAHDLACAYRSTGRVTEAIALLESVLADYARVLGTDHPGTLICRHNLAGAYQVAQRTDHAIGMYEALFADARRILGDEHPHTRTIEVNLSVIARS